MQAHYQAEILQYKHNTTLEYYNLSTMLRLDHSFISKLNLIIISSFLIQNKHSNEWSNILVVQIFLSELKRSCLKKFKEEESMCIPRAEFPQIPLSNGEQKSADGNFTYLRRSYTICKLIEEESHISESQISWPKNFIYSVEKKIVYTNGMIITPRNSKKKRYISRIRK